MRRLLFLILAACHASPTTHPPIAFVSDAAAPVVVDAGQAPPVVGRESLLMRGPSGTVLALDPDDSVLRAIDIRDGSIRTLGSIIIEGDSGRGGLFYAGFDAKRSTLVILDASGELLRAPVRLENGMVSLGKITKTRRMLDHMPSYFVEDSRLAYHANAIAFHVHEGDGNSYFALQSTLFGIGVESASPPFHFVAGKQPHARPPSRMRMVKDPDREETPRASSRSVAPAPPPPPPPPLACVQWIGSEDDHTLILLEYNFAVRRLDVKTKRVETIVPPRAAHDCGNWETPVFMLDHSLIVPHDGIRIDLDTKMTTIVTSFVAIVDAHSFAVDDNHDIWAARDRMIVKLDGKTFAIAHQIGAKN